ncbi:MAG: hypothetical protein IH624_00205 [Phycisphaerae bacterium]|nr:hypothetical protein [Phycisphaerae bacterium]
MSNKNNCLLKRLILVVLLTGLTHLAAAATEFIEDFSSGLPAYMEQGQGFGAGAINFTAGNASWPNVNGFRQYVRTKASDYSRISFVFEGNVTLSPVADWGAAFFGIGKADGNPNFYGEPISPTIKITVGPTVSYLNGSMVLAVENPDAAGNVSVTIPGAAGDGTHRLRLVWNALTKSAYAQIDKNYAGGNFVADFTSAELAINTLTAGNSHLYFGGGNSLVWDDLSVNFVLTPGNPIPANGAVNVDPTSLMSWDPTTFLSNAVYEISIGTDPNCNDLVAGQSTGSITQFNPAGLFGYTSTYYWRITAIGDNGTGASLASPPMVFSTGGKVTSHKPGNGSIAGPQTDLSWAGSGLAVQYRVYFAPQGQPLVELANSPYTDEVVPNADLPALVEGVAYQWKVEEVDVVGNALVAGDVLSFTVGVSNAPVTKGLVLHLDAARIKGLSNGDPVSKWSDFSGRYNDATQSLSARKPTYIANAVNGQPAVGFDAIDDNMVTPLILNAPYTVFAVFNGYDAVTPHRAIAGSNNWLIGPYVGSIQHYANGWVSQAVPMNPGQFYTTTAVNTGSASTFLIDSADGTNGAGTGSPGRVFLGANGPFVEPLDGEIAEVIIFDKALAQADLDAVSIYLDMKYGTIDPNIVPRAFSAVPEDGQDLVPTDVTLSWAAPLGIDAPTYDVWFGPQGNLARVGNQAANTIDRVGLVAGETYQWRIDVPQVIDPNSGEMVAGYVWTFTTMPPKAHSPSPADGAVGVAQNVVLRWGKGTGAESHDIYLSTVQNDVVTGAAFVGDQAAEDTEYDPDLAFGATYYWRIDETVQGQVYMGDIWSFTVASPQCSRVLAADINGDCIVNLEDIALVAADWLECVLVNGDCP